MLPPQKTGRSNYVRYHDHVKGDRIYFFSLFEGKETVSGVVYLRWREGEKKERKEMQTKACREVIHKALLGVDENY